MTGLDMVIRLYTKTIPEYYGKDVEIQILTPQVRGSLGTINLNQSIQQAVNPEQQGKSRLRLVNVPIERATGLSRPAITMI